MTAKLYPIINDTSCKCWCGPAAVCAVTGWPMSAVRAVLRKYVRRSRVQGTYARELAYAFEAAGWKLSTSANVDGVKHNGGVTLAQWLKRRRRRDEITLVDLGGRGRGHFVVVAGNRFIDNSTGVAVPIGQAPGRRRRVRNVYACTRVADVDPPAIQPVAPVRQRKPRRPQYRAGYVEDGRFVPVTEWASADDVDRDGVERAEHAARRADVTEVEDLVNGGHALPIVVEHRSRGFVRPAALWRLCDGMDRVTELDWQRDPEVALDTF